MEQKSNLLVRAFLGSLFALTFMTACSDPTAVGADILDGDQAELGFTDTISVVANVEESDSVITFSSVFQLQSYLFGDYEDPVFGTHKASLNVQVRLPRNRPLLDLATRPDFSESTLDSMILVLPYDPDGYYGDLSNEFEMEAYRITDDFQNTEFYYSTDSFMLDETQRLGDLMNPAFTPNMDSTTVVTYTAGEIDTVPLSFPHLKWRLDKNNEALKQAFFNADSDFYESDSILLDAFNGIHLRPSNSTAGLASFNLRSPSGGIYVYATTTDVSGNDSTYHYHFEINEFSARSVEYRHNYTGSIVENSINSQEFSDSLVFLQGMQGVNTRLTFPYINQMEGLIVNKAEIELRIADLNEDNLDTYGVIEQILVAEALADDGGSFQLIDDIALAGNASALDLFYGGIPETGSNGEPDVYRLNISSHFQDIIDGVKPNEIFLLAYPLSETGNRGKAERGNRVVLYGPKHSTFPLRLNLTFTRL